MSDSIVDSQVSAALEASLEATVERNVEKSVILCVGASDNFIGTVVGTGEGLVIIVGFIVGVGINKSSLFDSIMGMRSKESSVNDIGSRVGELVGSVKSSSAGVRKVDFVGEAEGDTFGDSIGYLAGISALSALESEAGADVIFSGSFFATG